MLAIFVKNKKSINVKTTQEVPNANNATKIELKLVVTMISPWLMR